MDWESEIGNPGGAGGIRGVEEMECEGADEGDEHVKTEGGKPW